MKYVIIKGKTIEVRDDVLDLSNKEITDITQIEGLTKLEDLKKLLLNNNQISDIKGLENLHQLRWLELGQNKITEIKGLSHLKRLKFLSLRKNMIFKIEGLETLNELLSLDLFENNIKDVSDLKNLPTLQTLNLRDNQIVDVSPLIELRQLEKLSVSQNEISDIGPLSFLPKLKEVDFLGNKFPWYKVDNKIEYIHLRYKIANNGLQDLTPNESRLLGKIAGLNDKEAQEFYIKAIIEKTSIKDFKSIEILISSSYLKTMDPHLIELFLHKEKFIPVLFSIPSNIKAHSEIRYLSEFLKFHSSFISDSHKKIIGRWILSLTPEDIITFITHGFLKCLESESIESIVNEPQIIQTIMKGFGTAWVFSKISRTGSLTAIKMIKDLLLKSMISRDRSKFSEYIKYNFLGFYTKEEFKKLLKENWITFKDTFLKMVEDDFGVFPTSEIEGQNFNFAKEIDIVKKIILNCIKVEFSNRFRTQGIKKDYFKKYFKFLSAIYDKSIVHVLLDILEQHYWVEEFSDFKSLILKVDNYNAQMVIKLLGKFIDVIQNSTRNLIQELFAELKGLVKCIVLGCYSTDFASQIEQFIKIFQLILTLNKVFMYQINDSLAVNVSKYDLTSDDITGIVEEDFQALFSIKKDYSQITLQIKNDKLLIIYPDYILLKKKFHKFNQEDIYFTLNTQIVLDKNLTEKKWFKKYYDYFHKEI